MHYILKKRAHLVLLMKVDLILGSGMLIAVYWGSDVHIILVPLLLLLLVEIFVFWESHLVFADSLV